MYPYFDLCIRDESQISFERWTNTLSVNLHCHDFYELLLIEHGSCQHMYRQTKTLLIPGDVVLVDRHQPHGFSMRGEVSVYNCQFFLNDLDDTVKKIIIEDTLYEDSVDANGKFLASLISRREDHYKKQIHWENYAVNNNKQGVIHLSPAEYVFVASILRHGIEAQGQQETLSNSIKRKCLELILLEIKQTLSSQRKKSAQYSQAHQEIIAKILVYIDEHLSEPLNFHELAEQNAFSTSYFRKLFKDVTGFSPLNYINRLKIIRSCECIQNEHKSISEAAEFVGIYDLNYFSRLFKKIMGSSPSRI